MDTATPELPRTMRELLYVLRYPGPSFAARGLGLRRQTVDQLLTPTKHHRRPTLARQDRFLAAVAARCAALGIPSIPRFVALAVLFGDPLPRWAGRTELIDPPTVAATPNPAAPQPSLDFASLAATA